MEAHKLRVLEYKELHENTVSQEVIQDAERGFRTEYAAYQWDRWNYNIRLVAVPAVTIAGIWLTIAAYKRSNKLERPTYKQRPQFAMLAIPAHKNSYAISAKLTFSL